MSRSFPTQIVRVLRRTSPRRHLEHANITTQEAPLGAPQEAGLRRAPFGEIENGQ
jgi:hypothetical protein